MKLDELTLGEIKQLISLFGDKTSKPHPAIGKKVIIRTYSAGVHYGTLESVDGEQVILSSAIRIWKWAGAFTLTELSSVGTKKPDECKFSIPSKKPITLTMIEILECTEEASKSIESVHAYVP